MFAESELSDDKFLCGKLHLLQPLKGYRAATDPVWLAASCGAKFGQKILDVGCGVGTAALCVGARVAGVSLFGLELQASYADLARQNAQRNHIDFDVYEGNILQMPSELKIDFDHVITNPPYHPQKSTASPIESRALAMQLSVSLSQWVGICAKRLAPGGWFSIICSVEGVPDILAGLGTSLGSVRILPLQARVDRPASRVILQARKGGKASFAIKAPFIIHQGKEHDADRENFTIEANSILREGKDLLDSLS